MKITANNFMEIWNEAVGFNFTRLLEDNQNVSLPMITWMDQEPTLQVLVYSINPKKQTLVSQKHFWNSKGHQMLLCKNVYNYTILVEDKEPYLNTLCAAAELLFKSELNDEEKEICRKYFDYFKSNAASSIYFAENKPLVSWLKQMQLI